MIRKFLKILERFLVGVGALSAILIVFSHLWTRYGYKVAAVNTVVIGTSSDRCQFSYEIPIGFWESDAKTGADALLRAWNKGTPVYLYAHRWFKPSYPGDWFITGPDFNCTVTLRGIVQGKQGAAIPTFFANRCQTPSSAWEYFKQANVLYAQVPVGDEVDVIAFTSRSEEELMKLEKEFRHLVATHYYPRLESEKAICAGKLK